MAHFQLFLQLSATSVCVNKHTFIIYKKNYLAACSFCVTFFVKLQADSNTWHVTEGVPAKHNSWRIMCILPICQFTTEAEPAKRNKNLSAGCGIKVQMHYKYLRENEKCLHKTRGQSLCVKNCWRKKRVTPRKTSNEMRGEMEMT